MGRVTKRELTDNDVPIYRRSIAVKQKYLCAICGCSLGGVKHALDHCHSSGNLRGVLCTTCNRSEGKVKAGAGYMAKTTHLSKTNYIQFLKNLIEYLEHHEAKPSNLIHPTFDLKKGKQKPRKLLGVNQSKGNNINSHQRKKDIKFKKLIARESLTTIEEILIAIDKGETTAKEQLKHLREIKIQLT